MTKVSAGSYDLNKWLHGGYDTDVITTLYGNAGSGKTNYCMTAAVSLAKKGNKVIYIDTEGGFSTERVRQLTNSKNGHSKEDYEKALENILLLKPTNFEEQKDAFNELLKHLNKHISLIVVDGMTMLYRLEYAASRKKDIDSQEENGNGEANNEHMRETNAELVRQLRTLAEIARKQNIPIIVTNQTYIWENQQRMVAGDILKYWSKCLIELENESGRRTAHLRKHRSLPEKQLTYQIWDGGIRKRGWM